MQAYSKTLARVLVAVAMVAFPGVVAAQSADDYRGGWRTDAGEAHTYEFSIRGTTVRGIYCTYCADATTLRRGEALLLQMPHTSSRVPTTRRRRCHVEAPESSLRCFSR